MDRLFFFFLAFFLLLLQLLFNPLLHFICFCLLSPSWHNLLTVFHVSFTTLHCDFVTSSFLFCTLPLDLAEYHQAAALHYATSRCHSLAKSSAKGSVRPTKEYTSYITRFDLMSSLSWQGEFSPRSFYAAVVQHYIAIMGNLNRIPNNQEQSALGPCSACTGIAAL